MAGDEWLKDNEPTDEYIIQNARQLIKDSRDNFLFTFLGVNKSGKSAQARKIAKAWRSSRDRKKYKIVGFEPPGSNQFSDLIDYHIDIEDPDWAVKLAKYGKNILVILDDLSLLNEGDRPVKGLKSLLVRRANQNIDIICIYHNPKLVLNCIAYLTTHWFIFNTNPQHGGFKDKIPTYELCTGACNKVREYIRKYFSTIQLYKSLFPKFPHVVVDVLSNTMQGYNFDKEIKPKIRKDYGRRQH